MWEDVAMTIQPVTIIIATVCGRLKVASCVAYQFKSFQKASGGKHFVTALLEYLNAW